MDTHQHPLNRMAASRDDRSMAPATRPRHHVPPHSTIITIEHPVIAVMATILAIAALLACTREQPLSVWQWIALIGAIGTGAIGILRPKMAGWWTFAIGSAANLLIALNDITAISPASPSIETILLAATLGCVGLAFIAFDGNAVSIAASAAVYIVVSVCRIATTTVRIPAPWDTPFTYAIGIILTSAVLIGAGLAARRFRMNDVDNNERERLLRQITLFRRSNQLAIMMHDTLSNDLTFIAMLARRHQDDTNPDARRDWWNVFERSQRAFAQTHEIIALLAGDPCAPHGSDGTPYERIQVAIDQTSHELAALGYHGETVCDGVPCAVSPEAEHEALSLIRELGTNIVRHAAPGDDVYSLWVTLNADDIVIRQTNDIPTSKQVPPLTEAERSGRGLAMHRDRITRLGGILRARREDGLWLVFASIPCHPISANG